MIRSPGGVRCFDAIASTRAPARQRRMRQQLQQPHWRWRDKAPTSNLPAARGPKSEVEAAPTKQPTVKAHSRQIATAEVVSQRGSKGKSFLQSLSRRTFEETDKEAGASSSSSSSILQQMLAPLISSAEHLVRHNQPAAEELPRADQRFSHIDLEPRDSKVQGVRTLLSTIPFPSRGQRQRQRQRQGEEGLGVEEGSVSHVGGESISSNPRALAS